MKTIALAMLAAVALIGISAVETHDAAYPKPKPPEARCLVKSFRPWSAKVWNPRNWERRQISHAIRAAKARRLNCASPAHRRAMERTWQRDKAAFKEHQAAEFFRVKVTPFYCNGTWWATACEIPLHESGYGSGGGNLYGMLDAWALHGCTAFAPTAWSATKKQQDICASRHWAAYGRGGWPSY